MHIGKIILKNIRGFADLHSDLCAVRWQPRGLDCVYGDNGSRQSALLKAIAVGLTGKDTARALQPSFHRWIRNGENEASIQLEIVSTPVTINGQTRVERHLRQFSGSS